MTTYEKNLKTLTRYYPEMDIIIEKAKKNLKTGVEIIEEVAYDGEAILKVKKENRLYYLNGKRNTQEPAEMWVNRLGKLQRNAPVFIVGVGNPSYLKELVRKTENKIVITVYEPSLQIFLKFLEMVDIENWMEKHLIIFWVDGLEDMDEKHMRGMVQSLLSYEMLNFSKTFILPNYESLFPEKVKEFIKICRDIALDEVLRYNTKRVFSTVMVKNLLGNAKYLCDGYKTTQLPQVLPKGIPGILVAAGPSLNKNIHELKKAKGKAFIVAVDTAMKPLIREGIIPDMFAIIDAMKPLDLVKMEEIRNVPLMTTLNAAQEVLEYHTGMKFFYNEGYQFAERIFLKSKHGIGTISSGGSVATHIFSLFERIGITRVILVGQDLAYTNNKSHADGTFQQVMEEEDTSRFMMVEGNYEEKVPTRTDFKSYLDWYNRYIEDCVKNIEGFRVINATEGGAKIKNTEIMTLKEAIEQECVEEINIQDCLAGLSPMLDSDTREETVNYLLGMPHDFQKLKNEAGKIRALYKKLDKICDKKKIDTKEYLSILKKLEKGTKAIEEKSVYQLVEITMSNAQYILRNEQFLGNDSLQEEGKEIARKGVLYMDNVIKLSDAFKEYAGEVFTEKALRKMEE